MNKQQIKAEISHLRKDLDDYLVIDGFHEIVPFPLNQCGCCGHYHDADNDCEICALINEIEFIDNAIDYDSLIDFLNDQCIYDAYKHLL